METQNPYFLTKKTVTVKEVIESQKEIDVIDWDKVPNGTYMTGKIKGQPVEGVLHKEENDGILFFCQNLCDGDYTTFKYGFKYSWSFYQKDDGTLSRLVSDIQFPPKPDGFVILPPPIILNIGTYKAQVFEDVIIVGCQTIKKQTVKKVLAAMESYKNKTE